HPVGRVELVRDELLVLAVELLLVARDLLIRLAQLEAREVGVVQEDVILAVDLVDDEIGDDVVVAGVAVDETRLGIELRDLVGGLLDVDGADPEALGDLAPAVGDQLVEAVADEPEGDRVLEPRLAELQHEALTQVARADARRIEALDDGEHVLRLLHRVQRDVGEVALGLLGGLLDALVDSLEDLVETAGEVAVLVDVPDELVREVHLARVEVEQADLVAQMVGEIARVDSDRLVVLALLVLLAAAARVEAIEQDL